jgi:hypothetical protein
MKIVTSIAGGAAVAAAIACSAAANAAPTSAANVDQLVMALQSQGNTVIVTRAGAHPLSECAVAGVRLGQMYTRYDSGYPGAQNDPKAQAISMTVYVDAQC